MNITKRNLFFVRQKRIHESSVVYHECTDVWLVGDLDGYNDLAKKVFAQADASTNLSIESGAAIKHGMPALLLRPLESAIDDPKIRIIERVRSLNGEPVMQMVMGATPAGYKALANLIGRAISEGVDDIAWHEHIDVGFPLYLDGYGGVALRICGPLSEFSRERTGGWADAIFERQPWSLPGSDVSSYEVEAIDYVDTEEAATLFAIR